MSPALWVFLAGALFIFMALAASVLKRLPTTTSMVYLAVGCLLGPLGASALLLDPIEQSAMLLIAAETAVVISLFTAGLKLRLPLSDAPWRMAIRLASFSMLITVGLVTLIGVYLLGLPLGAAVLLGAVLSPTDPVLASDVQVDEASDSDRLRFGLTGEAGLNDGTAFPFVMLGLGLLGAHELGEFGWRWLAVDVVWAVFGGLAVGALLGTAVGKLVLYLRRQHQEALGSDDFLALGLIALSYGLALLISTYGFVAVFAAGLALRRVERRGSSTEPPKELVSTAVTDANDEIATNRETAPAFMAQATLQFNEQLERIGEVALVVALGAMVTSFSLPLGSWWFVPLLFLAVRPVAVLIGLAGSRLSLRQLTLTSWFGIRGIGSIYYLMYAIEHGLSDELAAPLVGLTLMTVAASIVVHGLSVTPIMDRYRQRQETQTPV